MKILYQVCLFFSVGSICFFLGVTTNQWYYSMVQRQVKEEMKFYSVEEKEPVLSYESEVIDVSLPQEDLVDCDTIYVVEEYNGVTKNTNEIVEKLPGKYIGMNRTSLANDITQFSSAPSLSEKEKGFVSAHLVSFSNDRIVVRKNYFLVEDLEKPTYYFLKNENGIIYVYEYDLETLFLNTGIEFDLLPSDLQEEIGKIKRIDSEEDVYRFLEAYSS